MKINKKIRSKKAYVKTLEAVIALVLSFLFITFFVPAGKGTDERQPDLDLVNIMGQNPDFRRCVMNNNYSCINATFEEYYPAIIINYNYLFNISTDPKIAGVDLPTANIHSESLLIAGNDTYIYPRVVRLYYWPK